MARHAPRVVNGKWLMDTNLHNSVPAVVVRELEKRFGRFVAVDRISFEVAPGEIFGFLGPNGAGKSTTIRMLCGILAPSGGSGVVAGFDIRRDAEKIECQRVDIQHRDARLHEHHLVEECQQRGRERRPLGGK